MAKKGTAKKNGSKIVAEGRSSYHKEERKEHHSSKKKGMKTKKAGCSHE